MPSMSVTESRSESARSSSGETGRKKRSLAAFAWAFGAGVGATLAIELVLGAAPTLADDPSPYANLATFARVLSHIEASHVEPPDQDALVYGAIRGMVETLDPHTAFLDPSEYRQLVSDTEGQFAGIGVEIDVRDGWMIVHAVMPGGPAAGAGLMPGDRFLTIDGVGARDMRMSDAIRRMRGEPGTDVLVRLRREGTEAAVEARITRAVIHVDAVEARVLPDRVVYVRLRAFQETTTAELRAALDRAIVETRDAGGVAGVLLDLRGNPGGLLDEAVRVSDEFLSDGVIVSTRGRGGTVLYEQRARGAGTRPDWPMLVLVDSYSASAAEIVAGALQDHHRAVIAGTRTWGKGSVQNLVELPDGSALKLTVARYYTPSGASIQARGIEPDVRIDQLDPARALELAREVAPISEASLEGHLAETGPRSEVQVARDALRATTAGADDRPFADDYQARMAHQMLHAMVASRAMAR